jgi:hypothetical protein
LARLELGCAKQFLGGNFVDVTLDYRPTAIQAQSVAANGIYFDSYCSLEPGCFEAEVQAADTSEQADRLKHCASPPVPSAPEHM